MNQSEDKTPELLTFIDALDQTQMRYRAHPHFKKLEGTPWENDAAVIAADMMVHAVKPLEARIAEREKEVFTLRGLADGPTARRQFPDGTVPGNSEEAAAGWMKIAASLEDQVAAMRVALDTAHSVYAIGKMGRP